MKVEINGTSHELSDEASVLDALRAIGLDAEARGVAVAVGDRVVRRADWASATLEEGARVEVVTAAQGG